MFVIHHDKPVVFSSGYYVSPITEKWTRLDIVSESYLLGAMKPRYPVPMHRADVGMRFMVGIGDKGQVFLTYSGVTTAWEGGDVETL